MKRSSTATLTAQRSTHRRTIVLLTATAVMMLMLVLPGRASAECFKYRAVEWEFGKLVNAERSQRGLSKLTIDTELSRVSRHHSTEMRSKNSMYHTSMRTLGWRITNWRTVGENIAWRSGVDGVGARAQAKMYFNMFMASPTHKANILRSGYRHQGVGLQYTSSGKAWVTHTFEGATNPGTRITQYRC